jgi:hypothetical protein
MRVGGLRVRANSPAITLHPTDTSPRRRLPHRNRALPLKLDSNPFISDQMSKTGSFIRMRRCRLFHPLNVSSDESEATEMAMREAINKRWRHLVQFVSSPLLWLETLVTSGAQQEPPGASNR